MNQLILTCCAASPVSQTPSERRAIQSLQRTSSAPSVLGCCCHPTLPHLLPSSHSFLSVTSSPSSHLCKMYYWPKTDGWLFWELLWEMDWVFFCPNWNWEELITANCSSALSVTYSWNYVCSELWDAPTGACVRIYIYTYIYVFTGWLPLSTRTDWVGCVVF